MIVTATTYDEKGYVARTATAGNEHWENYAGDAVECFFGVMVALGFNPDSVIYAMQDFVESKTDDQHLNN